jgi:hypothetical protein
MIIIHYIFSCPHIGNFIIANILKKAIVGFDENPFFFIDKDFLYTLLSYRIMIES